MDTFKRLYGMTVAELCPSDLGPEFLSGVVHEDLLNFSPKLSNGNFKSESNKMSLRSPGLAKRSYRAGNGKWDQLDDVNKIKFTCPGTVTKTP
jgi:hypothetical protein